MEVVIKQKDTGNCFDLNLKGFTPGMVMSIRNALEFYIEKYGSPVGKDVLSLLVLGIEQNEKLNEALK